MLQELTDSAIPKLITICLASPVARSKSLAAPIKKQESKKKDYYFPEHFSMLFLLIKLYKYNKVCLLFSSGGSRNLQTGGRGLEIVLMPLHTYPMLL